MSEWWSYSLSDLLMFSARTYYRLFEQYNLAIWPAQLPACAIAAGILACARRGGPAAGRIAAGMLGLCWLWVAWAYHAERYATINTAAPWFAAGFALEGVLLLWTASRRSAFELGAMRGRSARIAAGVLLFAMLGYPLLAVATGRPWQQIELFGIAPDPTALATLGLLSLLTRQAWLLWPIPLLWCAASGATLWTMNAPDAWLVPAVAVLALLVGLRRAS